MEDIPIITDGPIERSVLYTIRVGEPVRDNIKNRLIITDIEFIKIREKKEGSSCVYYDEGAKACTIYPRRPSQCVALACWDSSEFMKVYKRPKADRKAIIRDRVLLALIDEHEKKCSYSELDRYVRMIEKEGGAAVEKILKSLKFDQHIRKFASEKLGISMDEMDFHFGRPLTQTITMFGLQVVREPDGSFFLTLS